MGTNDTTLLAEHKGNHFNSHMLMMLRRTRIKLWKRGFSAGLRTLETSGELTLIKLVREQSKQYLRFLEGWYQTCRSETTD